uniref:Uncharacterized protein n=1 Tax=Nelumbo nucifera TaxID=4432 RepID=A0A822XPF2_NELNU|nr:TPA_asm: hypothetical protein HUJ06_023773 [Nelumbo nucifera]
MVLKKITFLFLLVSASLISITFAGREFMDKPVTEVSAASERNHCTTTTKQLPFMRGFSELTQKIMAPTILHQPL